MSSSPRRSYPQDDHVHPVLQPDTSGHCRHRGVGHHPFPHRVLPPPVPLYPALVDVHHRRMRSTQGQPTYNYPQMFDRPASSRPTLHPPGWNIYSTEAGHWSDEDDDMLSGGRQPVAKGKLFGPPDGSVLKMAKRKVTGNGGNGDKSPAAGESASSSIKLKGTRGSKACNHCRRLKMRCVGADQGSPCERCQNSNKDCIFGWSYRGGSSSGRRETLVYKLKQTESKPDALK